MEKQVILWTWSSIIHHTVRKNILNGMIYDLFNYGSMSSTLIFLKYKFNK